MILEFFSNLNDSVIWNTNNRPCAVIMKIITFQYKFRVSKCISGSCRRLQRTDLSVEICFILVTQNHRMVEVERDLWRSSGPTPLLKQGDLELAAQDHDQTASKHLQGGRLHNHFGPSVPVLGRPHS